ncbi:MAG TPA: signal peptidase I [Candidatus Polarisedimenticolia bacterium]|nr:signal peptidase I [Candidatus Polarisedimenticolia bacterium]
MPKRSFLHDYFQAAIIAILIALFVRTYLVQAFQIPSPSMQPSILVGDHVLVNKFIFGPLASPAGKDLLPVLDVKRGDIIVFKFPGAPEKDYVKRVIGEPGDEVKIEGGAVFIKRPSDDFRQLDEPYVQHIEPKGAPDPEQLNDRIAMVVPPRSFYVLGDNRDDSKDSRDWGFVPQEYVRGKVLLVYWSVDPTPPPSSNPPPSGPVAMFWHAASASFSRTRWERTFHVIR